MPGRLPDRYALTDTRKLLILSCTAHLLRRSRGCDTPQLRGGARTGCSGQRKIFLKFILSTPNMRPNLPCRALNASVEKHKPVWREIGRHGVIRWRSRSDRWADSNEELRHLSRISVLSPHYGAETNGCSHDPSLYPCRPLRLRRRIGGTGARQLQQGPAAERCQQRPAGGRAADCGASPRHRHPAGTCRCRAGRRGFARGTADPGRGASARRSLLLCRRRLFDGRRLRRHSARLYGRL